MLSHTQVIILESSRWISAGNKMMRTTHPGTPDNVELINTRPGVTYLETYKQKDAKLDTRVYARHAQYTK